MSNINAKAVESQEVRALGFTLAHELSEEEIAMISGAAGSRDSFCGPKEADDTVAVP